MQWWYLVPAAVVLWQGGVTANHFVERRRSYETASHYAENVGKPLLIAGGPYGGNPFLSGFHIGAHGCGNYCLDLDPASCQDCPNFISADIRDIPLHDHSMGAALASHILEHMPTIADCKIAIAELYRVADSVFVVSPSKQAIAAWVNKDHHLWVRQEGDVFTIEQR